MTIALTPVKSSNIKAIGYDKAAQRLAVQFSNGTLFHYEGVTPDAYQGLASAESVGKHFGSHIRSNFKAAKQGA